jgi:hypothetical protein
MIISNYLVQKHLRITVYTILPQSVLTCGNEAWTVCKQNKSRIKASEIKFMRLCWRHEVGSLYMIKELNAATNH